MNRDEIIQKALDTVAGSALIPEQLNPVLSELAVKLNPLLAMMDKHLIEGDTYKFNQRTAFPSTPSVTGEKATTVSGQSAYNRESVDLKVLRQKGGVTGFQKSASRGFINSLKTEIVGSTEKLAYDAENSLLWLDADADQYQFSGFEPQLPLTSKFDAIGTITLSALDQMLDRVILKGGRGDKFAWVMSVTMLSKISALQTQIRQELKEMEVAGGWRLSSYRRVPIIESAFCSPPSTMSASTATKAAGGSLADDEWFYRVAAVTSEGETIASDTDSDTTSASDNSVTVAWSAFPDAHLYKIFRGTVTGEETLLITIAARIYDADGNVTGTVTDYVDDGSAGAPDGQTKPLSLVGNVNDESIFLVDLHPDKGSQMPYTNENATMKQIITFEDLAKVDDKQEYLIKSYLALAVRNQNLSIRSRNCRTA